MPSLWFLEITCIAMIVGCVVNPDPNPPADRYYKTKSECNRAAVEIAKKWEPGKAAWRFRCLPITKDGVTK